MEVSVSFTDEDKAVMQEKGYEAAESELGSVYYPKEGIRLSDNSMVNYMEYPWITCFETEGIEIV